MLYQVLKLKTPNRCDRVAIAVSNVKPIEQVNVKLLLKRFHQVNRPIYRAAARARLSFVDHQHNKAVVPYLGFSFKLVVVGRPPGGKIIQEMQRETGATISIEEKDNQGIIQIFGDNKESIDQAVKRIRQIVAKPEVGEIYEGKVKSIMPFGAFVEIMPGKDGLLHISEIDHKRIETMDGIFEIGDEVRVKLLDVDKQGKLKLSRKALLPRPEKPANA